jgi:hypothetical protein
MAELLVYRGKHWIEDYSKLELKHLDSDLRKKYKSRWRRGDVIDIHEDGYWGVQHKWNKRVYIVIRAKGRATEEFTHLLKEKRVLERRLHNGIKLPWFRRQYYIDLDQINIVESQGQLGGEEQVKERRVFGKHNK